MVSPAVGIGIWEELEELLERGIRIAGRTVGVILIWADFLIGGAVPPMEGPEAEVEVETEAEAEADAEVEETEEEVVADVVEVFFGIR